MPSAPTTPGPRIELARPADLPRLLLVWESSVRATHGFLTEADIQQLIPLVQQGLATFGPLQILREDTGLASAFMGVAQGKIEMLFIHAAHRGKGWGRILAEHALHTLGATQVDVNEQNPQAVGFYLHLGFHAVGRSALDAQGNPFPILHLART